MRTKLLKMHILYGDNENRIERVVDKIWEIIAGKSIFPIRSLLFCYRYVDLDALG